MSRTWLWWVVVACLLACGDDDTVIQVPPRPDAAFVDAGHDDAAVRECEQDSECTDGIGCTVDVCLPWGECSSVNDDSRCSDGIFCNGQELCDPTSGCRSSARQTCNDEQVCTIDRCDEDAKRCDYRPRDFDGDGEVDFRCAGGTDCDDFDPTLGTLAGEVCSDGVDNDCDGRIDESDCGGPPHDTCEDALDITGGGTFLFELRGARVDYGLSCGSAGQRDLVVRFALTAAADVTIEAQGLWLDGTTDLANVAVRSSCSDPTTELTCAGGFPARVRMRALPAGDYAVIVNGTVNARQILVKLDLGPPTDAPTNLSCDVPMDLGAGAHVEGDFVDVGNVVDLSCGFQGSPDLFYSFDVTDPVDVVLSTYLPIGERISVSLRTDCGNATTELRCITGAPAYGRFRGLPPGRYFLAVEGPFAREVDFSLDVRFEVPTPEPAGDSCATAIDLPLSTMLEGTLTDKQDLIETCGYFYRDAVYRLEITAPTDLRIEVDGADALVTLAVQAECGTFASQRTCVTSAPASTRLRNLQPGSYAVIVESPSDASFTVFADPLPLTIPVSVASNDTCFTPYDVPVDGGLFIGSTLTLVSDYKANCGGPAQSNDAVFKLVIDTQRRVIATLEGTYDTVLYRYFDAANPDPSVCIAFGESGCNDDMDFSTRSVLDETLSAGTHYYVVSGFGGSNNGDYTFEIDFPTI
jgi:uncharacterized protein (DUF2141 family)